MAEINVNVTPGSGGPNIDLEQVDNGNARQVVCIGDPTTASRVLNVDPVKGVNTQAYQIPADQCQSVTGVSGAAVTATLPAVASQLHYLVGFEVTKIFTAANAASANPLVITTANLPGSLSYSFGQPLGTIGTSDERVYGYAAPVKSSIAGTTTTITCPATVGIIWRINVHYYVAP
jgi:hypothetical protein